MKSKIFKSFLVLVMLFAYISGCSQQTANTDVENRNEENEEVYGISEVSFTSTPQTNQLFARDENNESEVTFSGNTVGNIDSIKVTCTNNSTNSTSVNQQVISTEKFSLNFIIEAGLHEYLFKVYTVRSGNEELIKEIDHVVCGDVYIVHGQSNAWSIDYDAHFSNPPDAAKWIRTIGSMHVYSRPADEIHASNSTWYKARGTAPYLLYKEYYGEGMVGVLGMSLGLKMIDSLQIPVAIINGAGGGGSISHYLKTSDYDLNSAYGRLQYRINKAGFNKVIRGFIWNQGESNGGNSAANYKNDLNELYVQFKNDFSFEKFYLIQTPPGCPTLGNHATIREAQRQFFMEHRSDVNFMTRHGFTSENQNYFLDDNCHYHAQGYIQLANWVGNLILDDLFGRNLNYNIPNILSLKQTSPTTIVLEFDQEIIFEANLTVNDTVYYLKDSFAIENSSISITEIQYVSGNNRKLNLHLSEPLTENAALTYLHIETYIGTNQSYIGPWILSASSKTGASGFTKTIE